MQTPVLPTSLLANESGTSAFSVSYVTRVLVGHGKAFGGRQMAYFVCSQPRSCVTFYSTRISPEASSCIL